MSRPFTDLEADLLEAVEEMAKVTEEIKFCLTECPTRKLIIDRLNEVRNLVNHCFKMKGVSR